MSWRDSLRHASFRGVRFHVEVASHASGRRVALHEHPKRDDPSSEDLGRRARRFQVTAYLIGSDYLDVRDTLIRALEERGAGLLILPTLGERQVRCEGFNAVERRERGGFVEIDCSFTEAGDEARQSNVEDTAARVQAVADRLGEEVVRALDDALSRSR